MAVDYARTRARPRARRREAAEAVSFARRLDWLLLTAVGGLIAYGLWAISGITREDVPGDPDYFVVRQGIFVAVGTVAMLVTLAIDPQLYRRFMRPIYGALIFLLVVVLVVGEDVRGAKRWIDLGFFQFQPSEFGKLLVVLALAGFVADRGKRIAEARTIGAVVGLAALPIYLVYREPDFGTSLVYTAALAAILFVAGTRWLHLAALGVVAAIVGLSLVWLLPAAGFPVLHDYQAERITAFADPSHDPSGAGYNVEQSITAVGAGGLEGRGVDDATQTNLDYLPEHATDFVFASLAEQRGFVGASLLLLLYLLLIWRGLRVIPVARDAFSAIVAGGIVVAMLFQIFINVGMTMGIAPVTGIPLPFVSVGGSSLISNLIAIGILQAIHARGRRKPPRVS